MDNNAMKMNSNGDAVEEKVIGSKKNLGVKKKMKNDSVANAMMKKKKNNDDDYYCYYYCHNNYYYVNNLNPYNLN